MDKQGLLAMADGMPGTMQLASFEALFQQIRAAMAAANVQGPFRALDIGSGWGRMLPLFRWQGAAEAVGIELTSLETQPRRINDLAREHPNTISWNQLAFALLTHPRFIRYGNNIFNHLGVNAAVGAEQGYTKYFNTPSNGGMPIVAYLFGFGIKAEHLKQIFLALDKTLLVAVVAFAAALDSNTCHQIQQDHWQSSNLPSFTLFGKLPVKMQGKKGEGKTFFVFHRTGKPGCGPSDQVGGQRHQHQDPSCGCMLLSAFTTNLCLPSLS